MKKEKILPDSKDRIANLLFLSVEEILEIKTLLIANKIDYKKAYEKIKKLPKAWTTKPWKELQKIYLKDKCENCGSIDPPLVIKHKQPSEFSVIYFKLMIKKVNYKSIHLDVITEYEKNKKTKELKDKFDLEIGRDALLFCIEESIEYRQFKHIKTCCKRCAFAEKNNYVLCVKCKTNYHDPIYETCYKCKDE